MSHVLPLAGSPLRELFDVADLAAIGTGEKPLVFIDRAVFPARRFLAAEKAARQVILIAADGSTDIIGLYRVGKRGAVKRLWAFGPIPRGARLA